ncbi:DUF1801 domain-containing protein [Pedobacter yonginense]|uniref:DUF1801 domain-containing protein n=1 Tax=Pedobacter yonginense TaxID=651869 RepID=A0A317ERY6_9SPHI|nr:DUF1801 domain-containing protein [Pedobacter yonginense]PWS28629.1 DUF1801 domain-containing protein [Pedobacter yonginense]
MKSNRTTLSGQEEVNLYLSNLQHPFKAEVELLRSIILSADDRLKQRIKWNAPSFYFNKDLGAFNLRAKGYVQIIFVFYDGNMIESEGLLLGNWRDRREARFYSLEDIQNKTMQLTAFVQEWMKTID